MRPNYTFKDAAESWPIATAFAFGISAFVNATLFWVRFRIDYFSVAQPSDIVMSGFKYVTLVLLVSVPVYILNRIYLGILRKFHIQLHLTLYKLVMKRALTFAEKRKLVGTANSALKSTFLAANLLVGGVALIVTFATVTFDKDFTHGLPPQDRPFWQRPLSDHAVSRLYLSPSDSQFEDCGKAPVLWMGSSTAVLNCRNRLRIVSNSQTLLIERLSPSDVQALKAAARVKPDKQHPAK